MYPVVYTFWLIQIASLKTDKVPIVISSKYTNFANIFSLDLVIKLPEYTRINDYTIKLIDSKQLPYEPIYSLKLVELETLKTYIETNLANDFIRPSKSLANISILFIWKPDDSPYMYINYWSLNIRTIINRYLLPLISGFLDRLDQAKRFTQFNLTSIYYQIRICKGDEWKMAFKIWYGHFKY